MSYSTQNISSEAVYDNDNSLSAKTIAGIVFSVILFCIGLVLLFIYKDKIQEILNNLWKPK